MSEAPTASAPTVSAGVRFAPDVDEEEELPLAAAAPGPGLTPHSLAEIPRGGHRQYGLDGQPIADSDDDEAAPAADSASVAETATSVPVGAPAVPSHPDFPLGVRHYIFFTAPVCTITHICNFMNSDTRA
jgi:hypothetical protein